MPWYYAGPEAKPVGPVSAEQLQGLFASGTITSETFVIEHTGPGAANLAWRRYREVFSPAATLPPIPPMASAPFHPATVTPPAPLAPIPGTVPAPNPSGTPTASHPLFPSAGTGQPGHPTYPAQGQPYAYPIRPTNSWCAWGFALSLVGLCLTCACIGVVPAVIAAVLCIIGLVQVSKNREQGGMGLAITGLIFSAVAVLLFAILVCVFGPSIMKGHGLTVTEQTSNDSE
jgi:hypothetical protein